MAEIARRAGIARSALYTHFRNKDDVLAAIAQDYGTRLVQLIDDLPPPEPDCRDLRRWLEEIISFTVREEVPTILFLQMAAVTKVPRPINNLGARFIAAVACKVPSFEHAIGPGPEQQLMLVRATLIVQQIGWTCLAHLRDANGSMASDMVTVLVEMFEDLLRKRQQPVARTIRSAERKKSREPNMAKTSQVLQ
jgi:AcrR family transcriptional regulator